MKLHMFAFTLVFVVIITGVFVVSLMRGVFYGFIYGMVWSVAALLFDRFANPPPVLTED